MEQTSQFQFKSKLLKGRTRGIASMVGMAGGRDCHIEIDELLALAGADSETPRADIDEARAELQSVFASKKHPFWGILDEKEKELIERVRAEAAEKSAAEWKALSWPQKILKGAFLFITPWVMIYLAWKLIICPNC